MATAGTIQRENIGSLNLLIVPFTSVTNDDTYASGLGTEVIDQWFNSTLDGTQGNEGVNVSESSGTFTFITGEDSVTGTLFILTRV